MGGGWLILAIRTVSPKGYLRVDLLLPTRKPEGSLWGALRELLGKGGAAAARLVPTGTPEISKELLR